MADQWIKESKLDIITVFLSMRTASGRLTKLHHRNSMIIHEAISFRETCENTELYPRMQEIRALNSSFNHYQVVNADRLRTRIEFLKNLTNEDGLVRRGVATNTILLMFGIPDSPEYVEYLQHLNSLADICVGAVDMSEEDNSALNELLAINVRGRTYCGRVRGGRS